MKKYDKYKQSGIEWLGDVPEQWEVKRVKDIFTLARGKFSHRPRNDEKMYEGGSYPFIQTGDVAKSSKYITSYKQVLNENGIQVSKRFKKGTMLMTIAANIGDVAILDFDAFLPDSLVAFHSKQNTDFYFYLLSATKDELDTIKITNTQDNLNLERLNAIFKLLPPISEQTAIATYLDTKTQAIDKKIALLTEKTNHYKALRKSIINDAVCKGLDKNVEMKESGISFDVNAKWEQYRLKDLGVLYSGLSGKAGDDFNKENDPNNKNFIPFTNIANNTYLNKHQLGTVTIFENEKQNKVKKGDLFFLMSSEGYEDIGKTAVLADELENTYLNSFCKGFRVTNKNCDPYFINYLLLSDNYRKSLIIEGKGFTRINLKMEKVTDFCIYVPTSKSEQTAIATYLDEKTGTIDAILKNIDEQITCLKELRKTLINAVVTGKVKVSDV
jgi:type I restriction enzyme, S subunit